MTDGPLVLAMRVARMLDEVGATYALGGSLASSLMGEPRSTADVDIAVRVPPEAGEMLLADLAAEFYVPPEAARAAVSAGGSFNVLDTASSLKVDLFVLGKDLLDRMQIERRVFVALSADGEGLWVSSPEDQILRKLDWYRRGGRVSERQWQDVVGIIRVHGGGLDLDYLNSVAREVALEELLSDALRCR